jgi:hypothetical protein
VRWGKLRINDRLRIAIEGTESEPLRTLRLHATVVAEQKRPHDSSSYLVSLDQPFEDGTGWGRFGGWCPTGWLEV